MRPVFSLTLNIMLLIFSGAGIIPSFRLAFMTIDKSARSVRFLTAIINVALFSLAGIALVERLEAFGLIPSRIEGLVQLSLGMDIFLVISSASVFFQLYNANEKIHHLTRIYNEVVDLRQAAFFDSVTRLHNRRALSSASSSSDWEASCVIMIDIDDFKIYNDTYGHVEGDNLLARLGDCILRSIQPGDMAFRYGGEEFLIICPEANLSRGCKVAAKIQEVISNLDKKYGTITVSMGLAAREVNEELEDVISRADIALYEAKDRGKNRIIIFDENNTLTAHTSGLISL